MTRHDKMTAFVAVLAIVGVLCYAAWWGHVYATCHGVVVTGFWDEPVCVEAQR